MTDGRTETGAPAEASQGTAPVEDPKLEAERQQILDAQRRGRLAALWTYTRLSGPGWLQSAITLGGGSLAGSLYLGVIGGYEMMWFQPLMMIFGVIMLSAIAYVALSTGEKPFRAINRHINPVLGWGWLIASMLANLVWAMPQFSLGTGAFQQNLLPELLAGQTGEYICIGILFVAASVVVWFYDSGGWGVKLFELLLKIMVAIVVLSFFGVVIALSVSDRIPWHEIGSGFIPDFSLLFRPAEDLQQALAQTENSDYWRSQILSSQRDRMATAAATAVGINMTFLLPYSMLRKGWDSNFRGLATFDLSIGLFVPFLLATSCVMIASAHQFHNKYDAGLLGEAERDRMTVELESAFYGKIDSLLRKQGKITKELQRQQASFEKKREEKKKRIKAEKGSEALTKRLIEDRTLGLGPAPLRPLRQSLSKADRRTAAKLVSRDAFQFATSLQQLLGKGIAQYIFGVGVVGMAISTIIILMLINGFTVTEAVGADPKGWVHRVGAMLPGFTGALGFIFLWTDDQARFLLAVPTSVFGMALLPIAYITFLFMMNSRGLLGNHRPAGVKRLLVNVLMLVALSAAGVGAFWAIWGRTQTVSIGGTEIMIRWLAFIGVGVFIALAAIVHYVRKARGATD